MTVSELARATPSPAPSAAGEGVTLPLAGESIELRFSARNIIKVENGFGSHEEFLAEFDRIPVNTLAWVLVACCGQTEDRAKDLLDTVNWRDLVDLVHIAWRKANWEPEPSIDTGPTQGP